MKKKVLFFIDSLSGGGAERVVSVLANEFIERGIQVGIVMLRKCPIAYQLSEKIHIYYAEDLPISNLWGKTVRIVFEKYNYFRKRIYVPIMRKFGIRESIPKWNETSFYFYAVYGLSYHEFLKKHRDSVAFGFLIRSNISLAQAARGIHIKTVFCERNNPVRSDMPKNIIRLRDRYCRRFSISLFQTEEESDYYSKFRGDKYVIPNPIKEDLPSPYHGKRRHEIVNFCRITPQKNLKLLVDAFAELLSDYPDYTLRIYGNGDSKEALKQYIERKNLNGSVFLEDFAADIHYRVRDAAMFVSTSEFEGLSNSMIEAMALGLPCICTDCEGGGARMVIQNRENGLLVPNKDLKAVVNAMREVLETPELALKISTNSAKLREDLSVKKIADQWMQLI